MKFSRSINFLVFFIVSALIIRVIINILLPYSIGTSGDDSQFFNIGSWLLKHWLYSEDGLHLTAIRPPLFPLIVALLFKLFGVNIILPKIFLACCDTLIGAMIYLLSLKIFKKEWPALLSAALWLFNPLTIYFTLYYNVDILMTLFLLLFLYFDLEKKTSWAFLFLALAALTKSIALYLVFLYLAYLIIKRVELKKIFAGVLIAGIVLLPWGIFNKVNFGHWNFGDTGLGMVLWGSNNELTYNSLLKAGTWISLKKLEGYPAFISITEEYPRNAYAVQKGLNYILLHPLKFLMLTPLKFGHFWNFYPGISEEFNWLYGLTGFFSFGIFLPFFILGLIKYFKKKELTFSWAYILYFNLVALLTYGSLRLRMPISPLVYIISCNYIFVELFKNKAVSKK